VFRFDRDVTGDGVSEMFLGSSLWSRGSDITFQAFKAIPGGAFEPYRYASQQTGLSLFGDGFWVEKLGSTEAILTFVSYRGKNHVGRYSFHAKQVTFDQKEVDEATFNQLKSAPTVKRVVPEVRGVLLVDLLRNPSAEWKRIDFGKNAPDPNGYFIAAEDAERVKGLANFTPQLALRWHASAAEGKPPRDDTSIPQPAPLPRQEPGASSASTSLLPAMPAAQTPAAIVERKLPAWPWVVGIAALTVIALLLWKRRA